MKSTLFFETHSSSVDNETGIASGILDPPLSETGRKQAQNLGQRYKDKKISALYCSDLQRAYITASIAFGYLNIPIIQDPCLREWNYGNFNGSLASEVELLKPSHIEQPFPNGESLLDAIQRVSNCLQTIDKGNIVLIGHRVVYYALEHLFKKRSLKELVITPWHWQPGWVYEQINLEQYFP